MARGAMAAAPSSGSGVRELEALCCAGDEMGEGVAVAAGLALGTAAS